MKFFKKFLDKQIKTYISFNKNIKLLFGASFLLNFAHSAVWLLTNFLFIEYGYNQAQLGLLNAPEFDSWGLKIRI